MSTPPTNASGHAASTTPPAPAARASGAPAGAARPGASGPDLFAGLLSLLSADPALPAVSDPSDSIGLLQQPDASDSASGERNADPAAQSAGSGSAWGMNDHPLAALMAWSSTPSAWSSLSALGGSAAGPGGAAPGTSASPTADGGAALPASGKAGGVGNTTASALDSGAAVGQGADGSGSATGATALSNALSTPPTASATMPSTPTQNPVGTSAAAAAAAWQPATPSGSPLPAGMTALPQPVPLNPESAAALAHDGAADAAGKPRAEVAATGADSAPTPAAAQRAGGPWRSTTTIAHQVSTHSLHAFSGSAASHAASHGVALAAGLLPAAAGLADAGGGARARSTVLLDDRFTASGGAPGPGNAVAGDLSAAGTGTGQAGGGQAGSDGRSGAGDGPASPTISEPDAGHMDRALGDPNSEQEAEQDAALAAEGDDALPPNLPQNLRQASLRVGDGGDDAIDIRLSLSGEQLSVDFRTDDPNTRDRLQDNADATLGELLQRSGLQLGGVSVGSQTLAQDGGRGQPPPHGAGSGAQRAAAGAATAAADQAAGALAAAPRPGPRSDGSQPLDLFV